MNIKTRGERPALAAVSLERSNVLYLSLLCYVKHITLPSVYCNLLNLPRNCVRQVTYDTPFMTSATFRNLQSMYVYLGIKKYNRKYLLIHTNNLCTYEYIEIYIPFYIL